MTSLAAMGWHDALAAALTELGDPALAPMRVVMAGRGAYHASDGEREVTASLKGKLRHRASPRDLPAVGDWVAIEASSGAAVVAAVLPRTTLLTRRDPDQRTEQVLVANVDQAILVMGLDGDFNLRRLERYLTLVRGSGVAPVVALTKVDLCADPDARRVEVEAVVGDAPVVSLALLEPGAAGPVAALLAPATTSVLLGSSGVGKSTLLNGLVGTALQPTALVREHDSRGRHTTTRRQMFRTPAGALVIDTPGLRELDPMGAEEGLADAFRDVADEAARCKFRDCRHLEEPGCAVRAAVAGGRLAPERVAAFRKLADPVDRGRR